MTLDLNGSGRTPRIAIMGEFNAGKSTLCNLLMRTRALPEQVTATRLAPVWMTRAPGQDMRVTLDGDEQPINIDTLNAIPFEDTLYVRLCLEADILDHCDFIDFPGISDPNMDAEVWERVLVEADAVIWLTHATQAWRQSEAAVWETVPEDVRARSILLVTRFDKLTSEADRGRVLHRLNRETGHDFAKIFPISLTDALDAQDDYDAWDASGAAALLDHLAELIGTLSLSANTPVETEQKSASDSSQSTTQKPATVTASMSYPVAVSDVGPAKADDPAAPRVVPRRVKPSGASRRERPQGLCA